MESKKIYVAIEYGEEMNVKKIKTTESQDVVNKWLHEWSCEQSERFNFDKKVHVDYLNLYAEIEGEVPFLKIEVTETEVN